MKVKIFIILLLMSTFSCSRNFSIPKIESYIVDGTEVLSRNTIPAFKGLKGHLDKIDEGESLNILLTHGMGITDVSDYDEFICNIGLEMGFEIQEEHTYEVVNVLNDCEGKGAKIKLFFLGSKETSKKINAFFLNWSPLTQKYKDSIAKVEKGNNAVCINKQFLKKMVNDSFSDITALNDKEIQLEIFKALEMIILLKDFCEINEGSAIELNFESEQYQQNEAPLIFITGSFGSKIMYEFLANYISFLKVTDHTIIRDNSMRLKNIESGEEITYENVGHICVGAYAKTIDERQKCWYLLSNQFVLLDAIKYDFMEVSEISKYCGVSEIAAFRGNLQSCRESLSKSSTIISFFDPNDPLGFEIPAKSYENEMYTSKLYNVKLANAKVHLGIFANPIKAHAAKENVILVKAIINGLEE